MPNCLIIQSEGEQLTRGEIDRGELAPDEIEVEVYFCGVCHSDIHQGRNDWGRAVFPLVPGHEATGIVKSIGSAVSKFAVGDRVGVGVFKDSCGECEMCVAGKENYCLKGRTQTYNAPLPDGERTKGGYAHTLHARESFAHHIPENLSLDAAAPLLCAGITTYAPLRKWGVGPGSKVAVVGVGGLGHMAIKFAAALGAEVSVIGRNDSKKQDAFEFGATEFLVSDEDFEQKTNHFDLVLNASSAAVGVDKFLKILKPEGVLVMLGLPVQRPDFDPFNVVYAGRIIAGSNVAPMKLTEEMLQFASEKNIVSEIELCSADEINEAWERVENSDVRYRFVLDAKTI